MVLVSRERQCLGGSALSMTMIPSDNKAEHMNITIAKTHNITNWPIQWVIGQFDEIGQLGAHYMRIGQFDVTGRFYNYTDCFFDLASIPLSESVRLLAS